MLVGRPLRLLLLAIRITRFKNSPIVSGRHCNLLPEGVINKHTRAYKIHVLIKYSRPPPMQYRPSVHRLPSPPIPPPIFKSRIGFFLVIYIYDSFHRRFPNTAAFSSVPRSAVYIGRDDCTLIKYSGLILILG